MRWYYCIVYKHYENRCCSRFEWPLQCSSPIMFVWAYLMHSRTFNGLDGNCVNIFWNKVVKMIMIKYCTSCLSLELYSVKFSFLWFLEYVYRNSTRSKSIDLRQTQLKNKLGARRKIKKQYSKQNVSVKKWGEPFFRNYEFGLVLISVHDIFNFSWFDEN